MPRTNPSTGNPRGAPRKPKHAPKAPKTTVPVVIEPSAPPSATPLNHKTDTALQALTGLTLPDRISAQLPQFDRLLQVADVAAPASFDAAGWGRVSDAQRTQDARHYRELKNYAANTRDGVGVLNEMALAAVAATEFGKNLVRYATGVEGMKTEAVRFEAQHVDTAIAQAKLTAKENDLHHQLELNQVNCVRDQQLLQFRTGQNQVQQLQYQTDLKALQIRLEATINKNDFDLIETRNRFPQLNSSDRSQVELERDRQPTGDRFR